MRESQRRFLLTERGLRVSAPGRHMYTGGELGGVRRVRGRCGVGAFRDRCFRFVITVCISLAFSNFWCDI